MQVGHMLLTHSKGHENYFDTVTTLAKASGLTERTVRTMVGFAAAKARTIPTSPAWSACRKPEPTLHVTVPSVTVGVGDGSAGHEGSTAPEVPAVVQRHVKPANVVGMTTAVRL